MKSRPGRGDQGQAVGALMTLFGGGQYAGEAFAMPGETQLRITDSMLGQGNGMPTEDAFREGEGLCERARVPGKRRDAGGALAKRRFSVACGTVDTGYMAVAGIMALIMSRGVRKFLVPVRGTAERESVYRSLTAYAERLCREAGYPMVPEIRVYAGYEGEGEGRAYCVEQLRRFASAPDAQILIMNREYFTRPDNLLLRETQLLDGEAPVSLLTRTAPVVVTMSGEAGSVKRLLERAEVFSPLCSLSFTVYPDGSGTTAPVYTPGTKQAADTDQTPEQLQI